MTEPKSAEGELDLEICLEMEDEVQKSAAAKKRSTKQATDSSVEFVSHADLCLGSQPGEPIVVPHHNDVSAEQLQQEPQR